MTFNRRETSIVKGMLARGDRQHDIAAFFGVNGGRIGEVSTGESEWASVEPLPEDQLPPKPPYPSPHETLNAKASIDALVRKVSMTDDTDEAKKLAVDGMWSILGKM
ncbi:MAG: hypothetical protein AAFN59_08240 [Pseudomonadota bacterium]